MRTSDSVDAVFPALIAAQAAFRPVAKSGRNKQQDYSYADLDDYLLAVRGALASNGLALCGSVVEIVPGPQVVTKGGTWQSARAHVVLRLIHTSGQWIEVDGWGDGADSLDKGAYKAITGARKYAVASLLGLATSDDPERSGKKRNAARPEQSDEASPAQIERLRALTSNAQLPEAFRRAVARLLEKAPVSAARATAAIVKAASICNATTKEDTHVQLSERDRAAIGRDPL